MSKTNILCFGEILWDVIPPHEYLGGAPLNVAGNLARLDCTPYMISAVGDDARGRLALERLDELHIQRGFVSVLPNPTGTAVVDLNREDEAMFSLPENTAYDNLNLTDLQVGLLSALNPKALVFGSLAPHRSKTVMDSLLRVAKAMPEAEVLYDVNLRKQYFSYETVDALLQFTTLLKLNDSEVDTLSLLLFDDLMLPARFARFVMDQYPTCHTVVVTHGAGGAEAFDRNQNILTAPAVPAKVVDTVGAGDAFSAGYLVAWLKTFDRVQALEAGNQAAAAAVSHAGAL